MAALTSMTSDHAEQREKLRSLCRADGIERQRDGGGQVGEEVHAWGPKRSFLIIAKSGGIGESLARRSHTKKLVLSNENVKRAAYFFCHPKDRPDSARFRYDKKRAFGPRRALLLQPDHRHLAGARFHPRAQTPQLPDAAGRDHRRGQRHPGRRGHRRTRRVRRKHHSQSFRVRQLSGGADRLGGPAYPAVNWPTSSAATSASVPTMSSICEPPRATPSYTAPTHNAPTM